MPAANCRERAELHGECQRSFRIHDRGPAARQHYSDGRRHQTGSCAYSSAHSTVHAGANRGAHSGGCADRGGVTPVGSVASPIHQLGFHLNLTAIGQLNSGDLDSQMRNA